MLFTKTQWGTNLTSKDLLGYAGNKKAKCEKINSTEKVNHLQAARTVAEALKNNPYVPEDSWDCGTSCDSLLFILLCRSAVQFLTGLWAPSSSHGCWQQFSALPFFFKRFFSECIVSSPNDSFLSSHFHAEINFVKNKIKDKTCWVSQLILKCSARWGSALI